MFGCLVSWQPLVFTQHNYGVNSSVVDRRVGDRKVAHLWFDSRTGNVSLGKTLYAYFPFGLSSLPVMVASLTKDFELNPKKSLLWVRRTVT